VDLASVGRTVAEDEVGEDEILGFYLIFFYPPSQTPSDVSAEKLELSLGDIFMILSECLLYPKRML